MTPNSPITPLRTALLLVSLLLSSKIHAQSVNLPLDHWAYDFLERLELKGLYMNEDFDTAPYSRGAIAEMILQIATNVKQDPTGFSAVERNLFEQLKGEFHEELEKINPGIEIQKKEHERHLWSWHDDGFAGHLEGLFGQQSRFETKDKVDPAIPKSTTSWGFGFRVLLKESMAIFFEGHSFILSGTDTLANTVFNPSLGLPVTRKALVNVTTTDNATGYAVFRLPWFDLEVGRDLLEWGPGFRGNLILSRNSNFYDLFKATFRYRKLKFEYFHAFLNAEQSKYLAGHRIEVQPVESLRFAINETVVYGGRSVEFLYANPFIPIIIAERHVGNKDNNMVSVDLTWFLKNNRAKVYAEFLFDDFNLAKNLFHDFVNKWGILFGGHWVDPFGVENVDFRMEYVRIQPFVYWHSSRKNTNFYTNYS
ncbi:MAG: capsule assembly Wzi family protein, partial [bacterium]